MKFVYISLMLHLAACMSGEPRNTSSDPFGQKHQDCVLRYLNKINCHGNDACWVKQQGKAMDACQKMEYQP